MTLVFVHLALLASFLDYTSNKAKEGIGLLANKLGIKDYSKYIDELDDMISNKTKMKDSIETKEIDGRVGKLG